MITAWQSRIPKIEEEIKYLNLIQLHHLTQSWLSTIEVQNTIGDSGIKRFVPLTLTQNLWLLEKIKLDHLAPDLKEIIEDTSVADFLSQLKETIWTVQISVFNTIISSSNEQDLEGVLAALKQCAWQLGRKQANKLWKEILPIHSLKNISQLISDIPMGHFLALRETDTEAEILWTNYPMNQPNIRIHRSAFGIQSVHDEWFSGYLYGMASTIRTEFSEPTPQGVPIHLRLIQV